MHNSTFSKWNTGDKVEAQWNWWLSVFSQQVQIRVAEEETDNKTIPPSPERPDSTSLWVENSPFRKTLLWTQGCQDTGLSTTLGILTWQLCYKIFCV